MNFSKINFDVWDRTENYTWFTTKNRCKINMTVNIDATNLINLIKENNLRFYPTFTYIVSKVLNTSDEFKMGYDEHGNLGVWDVIYPRYPLFHDDDKRISILWTEYTENFKIFYNNFVNDIKMFGEKRSMCAKGAFPQNCFDMSCLPWSSFTSFDCPPTNDIVWLPPFVMIGKFFESGLKILLPVAISVHHAVCDGYHVSKFFNEFQNLCDNANDWM